MKVLGLRSNAELCSARSLFQPVTLISIITKPSRSDVKSGVTSTQLLKELMSFWAQRRRTSVQAGRADNRSSYYVSFGYLHDYGQLGRYPGHFYPVRVDPFQPPNRLAAFGCAICGGDIAKDSPGLRAQRIGIRKATKYTIIGTSLLIPGLLFYIVFLGTGMRCRLGYDEPNRSQDS